MLVAAMSSELSIEKHRYLTTQESAYSDQGLGTNLLKTNVDLDEGLKGSNDIVSLRRDLGDRSEFVQPHESAKNGKRSPTAAQHATDFLNTNSNHSTEENAIDTAKTMELQSIPQKKSQVELSGKPAPQSSSAPAQESSKTLGTMASPPMKQDERQHNNGRRKNKKPHVPPQERTHKRNAELAEPHERTTTQAAATNVETSSVSAAANPHHLPSPSHAQVNESNEPSSIAKNASVIHPSASHETAELRSSPPLEGRKVGSASHKCRSVTPMAVKTAHEAVDHKPLPEYIPREGEENGTQGRLPSTGPDSRPQELVSSEAEPSEEVPSQHGTPDPLRSHPVDTSQAHSKWDVQSGWASTMPEAVLPKSKRATATSIPNKNFQNLGTKRHRLPDKVLSSETVTRQTSTVGKEVLQPSVLFSSSTSTAPANRSRLSQGVKGATARNFRSSPQLNQQANRESRWAKRRESNPPKHGLLDDIIDEQGHDTSEDQLWSFTPAQLHETKPISKTSSRATSNNGWSNAASAARSPAVVALVSLGEVRQRQEILDLNPTIPL